MLVVVIVTLAKLNVNYAQEKMRMLVVTKKMQFTSISITAVI